MTQKLPIVNVYTESGLWNQSKAQDTILKAMQRVPVVLDRNLEDQMINFILVDDEEIREYCRKYRNQDKPTNVLAFPYEDDQFSSQDGIRILGDIFLSFETIQNEAKEQEKSFCDHLSHLSIHGCLHLLGYDHQTESEAKEMEDLEIQVLKTLNIPNPYQEESY